jgi:hypothetical protein
MAASDGAVYVVLATNGSICGDGEVWRGMPSGGAMAWTRVHTDEFAFNGWQPIGVADLAITEAPATSTEPATDSARTGRNGMLVLSSATGKWTSYAY